METFPFQLKSVFMFTTVIIAFKKIFINFKIILDWSLLFVVFLVNGSEFPSVLYVE